jgi:phosphatidylethanolamine/phosphatidyl-N-methylethanolamine N-methyltransferase
MANWNYNCSVTIEKDSILNPWTYWRPIYRYTWALAQRSSYKHFCSYLRNGGKRVLDIGTGTGVYIKNLTRNNFYYFSDVDEKSLDKAKTVANKYLNDNSYCFYQGDALNILSEVSDVDIISLIHVISVVPEPEQLIKTAIEKLNSQGELIIYISSLSKKIPLSFENTFKHLGFKPLRLENMGVKWTVHKVSPLNECYVYRKGN